MRPFVRFLSCAVATLLLVAPTLPSQPAPRTLVWAVDGLSFEAFTAAQRRGLFRQFTHAGRHVAPFPSMSHPAWTEVTGADRLFGNRGRLRSVEANWFDLETMRVADDPRQVFARQAGPFNYMRAFDWFFDPIIEPLMYFEGDRLADRELAGAERDVLERFTGDHHVVFLGAADAIAHTHLGGLHRYLTRLDAMLSRVADSLHAKGGAPVHQFILSDHGNVGAFLEGAPERRLTPVSLDAAIRGAGLVKRDTGSLTQPNEVSIVTLALASMVNVYFADLGARRRFATEALRHPGVDIITWLEVTPEDRFVVIVGAGRGEAHLRWRDDGAVTYTPVTGNPLALPDSVTSRRDQPYWISDEVMRAVTMPGPYPDAPFRLVRSARKSVENAPDLVVSLRDGYCWAGTLGEYVQMVRTHGALGARSTLGLVASTHTPVPAFVRSHEVLAVTGLGERTIFHAALAHAPHEVLPVLDSLAASPRVVSTGRDDDTPDARFFRQVKPITLSAEYFDFDVLREMAQAARSDSGQRADQRRRLERTRSAVRRTRVVDGVTRHVDTLLALVDPPPQSLDADSLSHLLDRIESRVRGLPELAPLAGLRRIWSGGSTTTARSTASTAESGALLRRSAMASWTLPYYLDAVLDAPESETVPDPRDLGFAREWHGERRGPLRHALTALLADSTLAPRLFREVFTERELLRRVEGATVPTLYDAAVPEIAFVYVPGIFGELFDDEIWRRGLRSVRERLGVRVIPARTDGRCSAADNAMRLLQQLRDDTRRRVERGYAVPRYVLVGYSKGGVDAAHALVLDTTFAVRHVAALVTIATPHGGSPVAERSDIPDALMRRVVAAPRPPTCDTTRAVESLWPATRAAFWGGEGRMLGELVPLFSLSLVSDMRSAHPWMKITKRIARFSEENDGVVTRAASRFPTEVPSVHLGDVPGDHIAARSASAFPQESVMESILLTLNELGALEADAARAWRVAMTARRAAPAMNGGDNGAETSTLPSPAPSRRPRQVLPGGTSAWHPRRTFKMNNVEALADGTVNEATREQLPTGIDMRCDQDDMTAFRAEYEFLYDAGNGGSENNPENGFSIVSADTESGRACRLRTRRAAMKMTTVAFRFAPSEFPEFTMRLRVNRAVTGVAPDKGGRGRNDASIKVWYVLRDERPASKGRRLLFGYTWAGTDANGAVPASDSLVEAGASRRRIAFSVLPEAWLINIGGPAAEGTWTEISRDFTADLRRAYPGIPPESLRVIAITVQTDSDDTKSESDVLLDRLAMRPRER